MARIELLGISIKRPKDIAKYIPHPSEQQFALFLLEEKKEYRIYYERYLYTKEEERNDEMIVRSTRPDFYLVNKNNGHKFHIEITTSPEGKYKQKQVMMEQGVNYFVFYRDSLERLGDRYGRDLIARQMPKLKVA